MAPMAKRNATPFTARIARWRGWIQGLFLFVWLDPFMLRMHTVCSPVFHCYSCPLATFACPIGVIANFSALHLVPYLAIGTLAIAGAIVGSCVCGWACPFGLFQDLLARIPTPKFHLPGWMGYTRYIVLLVFVIIVPYQFGDKHPLFFCSLCPASVLEAVLPNMASQAIAGNDVYWPSAIKMAIFLLVFLAMFFTWRPWCTLFCPLGAIFGLTNKFSFFFLKYHPDQCNDCDLCKQICRYHGPGERRSSDMQCIRCLDCTGCTAVTLSSVLNRPEKTVGKPDLVQIPHDGDAT